MGTRRVTWLHLSDLHFKANVSWQQDVVLSSLARDVLERLHSEHLSPDLVFVTGDVAHSGRREEYLAARSFLEKVASITGVDPKTSWFMVPGNHDVDRARISRPARMLLEGLRGNAEVDDVFGDPMGLRVFTDRLTDYFEFTREFLGDTRGFEAQAPWRVDHLDRNGISLAIASLNSTWAAEGGSQDQGRLVIGERQLRHALSAVDERYANVRIALLHHPLGWLRAFDQERANALLRGKGGVNFLLRGHLHSARMLRVQSPDADCFEFAAGACWEGSEHAHGVTVVSVDFEVRRGTVHLWRYTPEQRGFWKRDNFLYEDLDGGRWDFELPERWCRPTKGEDRRDLSAMGAASASVNVVWDRDSYRAEVDSCRALIRVQVEDRTPSQERVPVHHLLVLDISGSMQSPEKYPLLVDAVEVYLDILAPDDLITLIPFSTESGALLSAVLVARVRAEKINIRAELDGWKHRFQSTYMNKALDYALLAIEAARAAGFRGVERANCLTDGELHDHEECQLTFRRFRDQKVETNLFGFGAAFSSSRAESLFAPGHSALVRYVASGENLQESFGHIARTSRRVIMTDAELTITIHENVSCLDVFRVRPHERHLGNYANQLQPTIHCPIGSLEVGKSYIFLLTLRPWQYCESVGAARLTARTQRGSLEVTASLAPSFGQETGILDPLVNDFATSVASLIQNDQQNDGDAIVSTHEVHQSSGPGVLADGRPGESSLKRSPSSARLRALRARISLYSREGRRREYIESLQRQLDILEQGGDDDDLSDDDRNYASSSYDTGTVSGRASVEDDKGGEEDQKMLSDLGRDPEAHKQVDEGEGDR